MSMENSQDMINTHSNMMLPQEAKRVPFKDNKERGWPSPSWDLKAPSSPLKSLKISVVRRPKHNGPGAQPKWHKTKAKQALRGVKQPQSLKHP